MKFVRFLLIPFSLLLFACASNEPNPPKTSEIFYTLTKPDGTKQFSYALIMELPERGGGPPRGGRGMGGKGPGGHNGGPPPGGPGRKGPAVDREGADDMQDKLKHLTEEGLLAKLEDTGFCRNGYRQLETQSRRGAMSILGECYDKATDEDRVKFPNPAPKKVIEEKLD